MWPSDLNIDFDITVPLAVNGAQRNPPEIRAELGQLRDVISHLQQNSIRQTVRRGRDEPTNSHSARAPPTCPTSCRRATSYILSMWCVNSEKLGMMNFFLKAFVSSMMLLPTHLRADGHRHRWHFESHLIKNYITRNKRNLKNVVPKFSGYR